MNVCTQCARSEFDKKAARRRRVTNFVGKGSNYNELLDIIPQFQGGLYAKALKLKNADLYQHSTEINRKYTSYRKYA